MRAKRLFLSFLLLVTLLFLGFLPWASLLPIKKTGSFVPKTVSVFTITPAGKQKLNSQELDSIFEETKLRLGNQGELTRLDSNRFELKTNQEQFSEAETKDFFEKISKKPVITVTNFQAQPLFFRGRLETNSFKSFLDPSLKEDLFRLPLEAGGAKYKFIQDTNTHSVELKTTSNALNLELIKAQLEVKDLPNGNNEIYLWQNLREFVQNQSQKDPVGWAKAEQNPVTYAIIKNPPPFDAAANLPPHVLQLLEKLNPTFIKEAAQNYLIGVVKVNVVDNSKAFELSNTLTGSQAKALAAQINFANANYSISQEYSYFEQKATNNASSALWILLILVLLIGLILVINYRFSGVVAFLFLGASVSTTLWFFAASGLGFSDIGFQVLIFSILALLSNIVFYFETLRVEFSKQLPLERALSQASKITLKNWLIANLILIVVATVLFYNKQSSISELGQSLIFSQVSSAVYGVGALRIVLFLLTQGGVFKQKHWFFGTQKSVGENSTFTFRILQKLSREEPQVLARFFQNILFVSGFIVLIVFRSMYPLQTQWGLKLAQEEYGTHQLLLSGLQRSLRFEDAWSIKELLEKQKMFSNLSVEVLQAQKTPASFLVSVRSFEQTQIKSVEEFLRVSSNIPVYFKALNHDNLGLVQNWRSKFLLLLSFLLIQFIVTVFIWRFSFSIALFSATTQALLLQIIPLAFAREHFESEHFNVWVLGSLLFNQQSLITQSQIKLQTEKLLGVQYNRVLSRFDIKHLVKTAAYSTLKPRFYTLLASGSLVISFATFHFSPAFIFLWIGILLTQILTGLGLVSRIYRSFLEIQNRFKAQRIQTYFWEVQNPVEQTFTGINDFRY